MYQMTVCNNLQKKLFLVYSLNVIDWVCTLLLLSTGAFYEANPIARSFIGSISFGFAVKCIVPFLAVYSVNRMMHILEVGQLKIADMMISFGLTVYLAVNIDHLINFIIIIIR